MKALDRAMNIDVDHRVTDRLVLEVGILAADLERLRRAGSRAGRAASACIRAHPWPVVAIGVVAGLLLGTVVARQGSRRRGV